MPAFDVHATVKISRVPLTRFNQSYLLDYRVHFPPKIIRHFLTCNKDENCKNHICLIGHLSSGSFALETFCNRSCRFKKPKINVKMPSNDIHSITRKFCDFLVLITVKSITHNICFVYYSQNKYQIQGLFCYYCLDQEHSMY